MQNEYPGDLDLYQNSQPRKNYFSRESKILVLSEVTLTGGKWGGDLISALFGTAAEFEIFECQAPVNPNFRVKPPQF